MRTLYKFGIFCSYILITIYDYVNDLNIIDLFIKFIETKELYIIMKKEIKRISVATNNISIQ